MLEKRIIPTLQLSGKKAVKTVNFANPQYLGDPVNIARIWSEHEAHEIIITDIDHHLNIGMLKRIARSMFVPVSYGGGIETLDDAREALKWGCEKVILGSNASKILIQEIADEAGSQAVVVSIDHDEQGNTYIDGGKLDIGIDVINRAKDAQAAGAGEIMLHSITRDGTFNGLSKELTSSVLQVVNVPVCVCGGASSVEDIKEVHALGASGCAAGSLFCFDGPSRNVLVSYRRG